MIRKKRLTAKQRDLRRYKVKARLSIGPLRSTVDRKAEKSEKVSRYGKSQRKDIQKTCKGCGNVYKQNTWRISKYCSQICYHVSKQKRVTSACAMCGTNVHRTYKKMTIRALVFCSHECSRKYHVGEHCAAWRGGSKEGRGRDWKRISESIRVRDSYTCRWCGKHQSENGKSSLSVDHVRPWRECESEQEANDPSNLVSLCTSCHGKKGKLERAWLRGDGLALQEYRRLVGVEPFKVEVLLEPSDPKRLGPPIAPVDFKSRGPAISAAKKAYYQQPGVKEKWVEINRAKAQSPEWRKKLSDKAKEQWAQPGMREAMVAGMKEAKAR